MSKTFGKKVMSVDFNEEKTASVAEVTGFKQYDIFSLKKPDSVHINISEYDAHDFLRTIEELEGIDWTNQKNQAASRLLSFVHVPCRMIRLNNGLYVLDFAGVSIHYSQDKILETCKILKKELNHKNQLAEVKNGSKKRKAP